MKEFEKFIAKQQFALLEYGNKSRDAIVGLYKFSWIAALKWAINEENYCTSLRCCVREKIEEELEGK